MKILKPERLGGSPIIQVTVIFLLSLFIGCIYIALYDWNISFQNQLFSTWWLWILPALPVIWFLWLIADSVIAFRTRRFLLRLIDFLVDETTGNIQITFRLDGFPESRRAEKMLRAKYWPVYRCIYRVHRFSYDWRNPRF